VNPFVSPFTGKQEDRPTNLPRGFAFEGKGEDRRVVPISPPPDSYFGEPPESKSKLEPAEEGREAHTELLREIFAILENGPPQTMAVRLAALKYHWRIGGFSLRESAVQANCSLTTMHRINREVERYFQRQELGKTEHSSL
jgi:hypothetical protein